MPAPDQTPAAGSTALRISTLGGLIRSEAEETRFESIAERKIRRRQLTEDGNVEISGQT